MDKCDIVREKIKELDIRDMYVRYDDDESIVLDGWATLTQLKKIVKIIEEVPDDA